jgi:hypothetical protein
MNARRTRPVRLPRELCQVYASKSTTAPLSTGTGMPCSRAYASRALDLAHPRPVVDDGVVLRPPGLAPRHHPQAPVVRVPCVRPPLHTGAKIGHHPIEARSNMAHAVHVALCEPRREGHSFWPKTSAATVCCHLVIPVRAIVSPPLAAPSYCAAPA